MCNECAKLGTSTWEETPPKALAPKLTARLQPVGIQSRKKPVATVDTTKELVGDLGTKVRQAREKLGLSHEELGKRINEKVSLLKKIETGKMTPNDVLATKLEHALKVKLIVPTSEEKIPLMKTPKLASQALTLGDLIQLGKKDEKKGESARRT